MAAPLGELPSPQGSTEGVSSAPRVGRDDGSHPTPLASLRAAIPPEGG